MKSEFIASVIVKEKEFVRNCLRIVNKFPDAPKSIYPMYGLILEINRYYLEELKLKYVIDGACSITEHSNIQSFLEEKFKFRKAYCDLQLFYKPVLGWGVKVLFPFRRWIKNKKVVALLRQEAWARGLPN